MNSTKPTAPSVVYLSGFDPVPEPLLGKLWPEGQPFYLKQANKPNSIVICLHGFGATPYETRPVADACVQRGMDAVAPLLPGHGFKEDEDQRRAIKTMTRVNVLEAIRQEIAKGRKLYSKVFLYGQSMGGAAALAIAGEGLVDACAATAPALKLPAGAGFAMVFMGKIDLNIKKKQKPRSFVNYSYSAHNTIAAAQLQRLSLHARKMLHHITCPVFIAHSRNDSTIDPVVTSWVQARAKGSVEIAWFDKSDHTMPLDVQGKDVAAAIAVFFCMQS
nr:alpha/beta fold hydrolase [Candidatus Sigynarchaeota archaeon]